MITAMLEAPTEALAFDPPWDDEILVPKGFEFVDGELRELNVSALSSYVAGRIFSRLSQYADTNASGWVFPEGISFKCFRHDPEKTRRADAAFHLLDRLTWEQATSQGHLAIVPDLVVEVVSPNDLAYEVETKRREWLKAGAKLVWVVYPDDKCLTATRPDAPPAEFNLGDTLTADPVLPEFRVLLDDLFRLPRLPGA